MSTYIPLPEGCFYTPAAVGSTYKECVLLTSQFELFIFYDY